MLAPDLMNCDSIEMEHKNFVMIIFMARYYIDKLL